MQQVIKTLAIFVAACGCTSSVVFSDDNLTPFGLETRKPWTTSHVVGTPEPPPPYTVERIYPQLTFDKPVFVAQEPGTDRIFVAELDGKIVAFSKNDPTPESKQLFLDTKRQIYAFSFHPQYETNGQVFVFSPTGPNKEAENAPADDADTKPKQKAGTETEGEPDAENESTGETGVADKPALDKPQEDVAKEKEDAVKEKEDAPEKSKEEPEVKLSRVSRFQASLEHPRTASLDSEDVIIEWRSGGHNGGEALIGPDGYLYISTGDGTGTSDLNATGQGVDDLFAVIMRLDVDHPDEGRGYSIPPDNPFVRVPDARPEIWAYGFRNPWRLSFDSEGRLWCGDVGQDLWEMIWLVEKAGNYGWSVQEGSHSFHPHKKKGPGPILPPVVEHHHSECRSITGGYVYEGDKHPELNGVYFYGDYEYGMIWGFRYDGKQAVEPRVLADTSLRIPTFGVTRDGEILVVDHLTGELYELVESPSPESDSRFPRRLSETGLFASVADHTLAEGVVPYTVNAPQWIDKAVKQRFVGLSGDSQITFVGSSGNASSWGFEDGTVAAETISIDRVAGDPASQRRIETRILVKQQNHWLGYSYLWNDEQTDATLVDAAGRDLTLSIADPQAPGGERQQTWHIPSRNECMVCHSRAAAFVLGLRTVQMNKTHDYGGIEDNQLRAFDHAGIFNKPLEKPPGEYKALPNPYDQSADINARARAYLHVNCSVCHVNSGGGNSKMVLTHGTSIDDTKLVNEKPLHGDFGLANAHLVTPGDPFASVLYYRLSKLGRGRMPLVSSNVTDTLALDLMYDWIVQLPAPDSESGGSGEDAANTEQGDFASTLRELQDADSSAPQRETLIGRLLESTRGAFALSRVVADGRLSESLKTAAIARGVAHTDANVRDLFERFIPESQRTKRLGDTVDVRTLLAMPGSAAQGRELFLNTAALQCKTCHRVNQVGGTLGPDLSQIGKKSKRHEILESLLDPSKVIDPKFATHVLVTTNGKVLTGILVEKTDEQVVLRAFTNGKAEEIRIAADEVDELVPQKKSLMPDRMLRDLTPQQAADLMAFLSSLREAP